MLRPMGHVNDGGESLLRPGFVTGAAAAFGGGGGVGRCVGGDLLWRAERVRAMLVEFASSVTVEFGANTGLGPSHVSEREQRVGEELVVCVWLSNKR